MKAGLFLWLTTLLGLARVCGQTPLADSVGGFSGEQGKQGWSYHFYVSSKDGTGTYVPDDVHPMRWSAASGEAKEAWSGPVTSFTLGKEHARPRVIDGAYQGWAVRRWTSTQDGEIEITGSVKCTAKEAEGRDPGDGIGLRIFVDGKEILTKLLPAQATAELQLRAPVRKGSHVDFAVTPGPGLNPLYDGAEFHAVINASQK